MKTDIPLKTLTSLCGADLLTFFGFPYAALLKVESLEMPASAKRLDNVLYVRSPAGRLYLLVIEWQGYPDPLVLWRTAGYCSWLGQQEQVYTVIGLIVYLSPACDMGDTLVQKIDDREVMRWHIPCVRLWEHEAAAAVASGNLGLTILSPLMQNATAPLVEQAIASVLQHPDHPRQADLLSILGMLAEPLMTRERFVDLIGREQLMASDLLSYLMEEKLAEKEAELAAMMAQKEAEFVATMAEKDAELVATMAQKEAEFEARLQAELEARLQADLQQTLVETLIARFQQVPVEVLRAVWQIHDLHRLRELITETVRVPDIGAFAQLVEQRSAK